MKITKEYLESKNACQDGIDWFMIRTETDALDLMLDAVDDNHEDYARWLMWKMIETKEQAVKIAVFSAEQVIDIFEEKYPEDSRPRKAIGAAKTWIANPCEETARASRDARDAAAASYYAARSAAYAAYAADARAARDAAAASYYAARSAAYAAASFADGKETLKKIIKFAYDLIDAQ